MSGAITPPEWMERSACSEIDIETFFPEKGGSTKEAKRICRGCEVRAECLMYALQHQERFGIWGGLSERERRPPRQDARPADPLQPMPIPPDPAPVRPHLRTLRQHRRKLHRPRGSLMTNATAVRTTDTLTVLKHLAAGRGVEFAAVASSVPTRTVREIADAHGWPDEDKIAWAVDETQRQVDDEARGTFRAGSAVPTQLGTTPSVATTHPVSRPNVSAPVTPRLEIGDRALTVEQMLTRASKSPRHRTKQAGQKIRTLVAELWERLEAEQEDKRAEAAAAAERAKYDTEVRRLEAELKIARELARKARVRAVPKPRNIGKIAAAEKALDTRGYDPKTVRTWARENGMTVPPRGAFLPKTVVQAWRDATTSTEEQPA